MIPSQPTSNNNTHRTLGDIVSVNGWYTEFDDKGVAAVHLDISFGVGRFGARPEHKIQFDVTLKNAKVIVRAPDGQPLEIIKSSVAHQKQTSPRVQKVEKQTKMATGANVEVTGSASLAGENGLRVAGNAKAAIDATMNVTESADNEIFDQLIRHFWDGDRTLGFEITSNNSDPLKNAPWDVKGEPRLRIRKTSDRDQDGGHPYLVMEVQCLRQDIVFGPIKIKDPTLAERMKATIKTPNIVAAQELLREELLRVGFDDPLDLRSDYATIPLAYVIVLPD